MGATISYNAKGKVLRSTAPQAGGLDDLDLFDRVIHHHHQLPFPPGVRMVADSAWLPAGTRLWVLEQPPEMRLVSFHNTEFYLPLPWSVYFLIQEGNRVLVARLFWRTDPLQSLHDELYLPMLPNLYTEAGIWGKVCPNHDMRTLVTTSGGRLPWATIFGAAIEGYWSSKFNDDLSGFVAYQPFLSLSGGGSTEDGFANWQQLNCDQMLSLPYAPVGTLEQLFHQTCSALPADILSAAALVGAFMNLVQVASHADLPCQFLSELYGDDDRGDNNEEDDEEEYDEDYLGEGPDE